MKIKWLIFLALLFPAISHAQSTGTFCRDDANCTWTGTNTFTGQVNTALAQYTVAGLPTPATPTLGTIVVVTDGQTASDCTVGGGTTAALCRTNGSAWISLGGSGGSGSPGGSNSQLQFNGSGSFVGAAGLTTNSGGTNLSIKGPIPYIDITSYMPQGGCSDDGLSLTPEQGTMTSSSPNLSLTYQNGIINGCGVFVANAGAQSTLSTPAQGTAPSPVVMGTAGSTTIHYKVAAIDSAYGTSAASLAITVTTAPSTRTATNYVAISWQGVANAVGYLVYTDQTGGGTYVPLTYSFDCFGFSAGTVCGAIDKGAETNSFAGSQSFWPTAPPASATYQALITTVVSGGGTDSLVLAANAQHSVSGVFTFPDNAPFFTSALTAAAGYSQYYKPQIFVPQGLWFTSTIPFPSSTTTTPGIEIKLAGKLEIFGLPVEGPLGATGQTGKISIDGSQGGGTYTANDWALNCAHIWGYPTLGSLFVVASGTLNLTNVCLYHPQTGIVQASNGSIITKDITNVRQGSGSALQIDNNAFFSLWDRTNWNADAFNSDSIPEIWFLGLTNTGHSSVFDFRDNSFLGHAVRIDQVGGGGPTGSTLVFDGTTNMEDGVVNGFFETITCTVPQGATLDNISTGDIQGGNEYLFYQYGNCSGTNPTINIHGETFGFKGLVGQASPYNGFITCRNLTYENPNAGGTGALSIGYFGSLFGTYTGCDNGATLYGFDVQTSEVLTSGGNDPTLGPAGEQMLGHVFRRPITTLTGSSSGGTLAAGNYYIVVTMLDAAGRESAPSPEQKVTTSGSTSSVAVSSVTAIYFPGSCNVYVGTSAGGETGYFNSTSVTNGTCTYTLTTTSGATTQTPRGVGNAMRTWLSEENNANSCLFCGTGGGLGTGFFGVNLTPAQYASPVSGAAIILNGGVAMPTLATSGSVAGAICETSAGLLFVSLTQNCYTGGGGSGPTIQTNGVSNSSQSTLNFITSTTNTVGLTITPSNPTGGNQKFEITGGAYTGTASNLSGTPTLPNGTGATTQTTGDTSTELATDAFAHNVANALPNSVTVNSQTCTLGSACTIPHQTNSTNNISQAGINNVTSTINAVGLTVTPTNSGTNQVKYEITGSAYTGTASNLSGTPALPNGTTATTQSPGDTTTKLATDSFVSANGTVNTGTQYAFGEYATASTVISSGPTPPTTKGQYSCGYTLSTNAAAAPTCPQIGLAANEAAGATVLFTDNNNVIYNPAAALALPTPTTLANTSFFTTLINNGSASTITPATNTISKNGGAGGSTAVQDAHTKCSLLLDQTTSTQWDLDCSDIEGYVNGGSMPASAVVLGTNSSSQPVAATTTGSGTTVPLATSPTFTTSAEVDRNALVTTPASALLLKNTTASTSGVPVQISPSAYWEGHVWNTTSVAADNFQRWIIYDVPTSQSTPYGTLTLATSTDTGTASYATKMTLNSFGQETITNSMSAYSYQTVGATFTASGCSNGTLVGGATAGSYDSGTSGTCTVTVTMGGSQTAAHGWACSVWDVTTTADVQKETAYTTTTVTFSGTTVSGDVIAFGCQGF